MIQPVLLLVDLQKGFDEIAGRIPRNNLNAEAHAMRLIEFWRQRKWPVIHVRHDSTEPDSPFRPERFGNRAMDFAIEHHGEPVLRKTVNSGFIGTDLASRLDGLGRPPVVVAGATTDHCVSTTVRMGANLGYPMTLVADACFTFGRTAPDGTPVSAEEMHRAHLASLEGEFARVVTAGALLAELAASPG